MKIQYFSLFPEEKIKKQKFAGMKDFEVKNGDIWNLGGKHILVCSSSCEKSVVDYVMQGKYAKLLFTSPPYADMRTYNNCDISIDYIKQFVGCFKDYVDLQCVNLGYKMKNGSIVPYWNIYIDYALDCGLKFLGMNIWNKMESGSIGCQIHYVFPLYHELILVFGKKFIEINRTEEKKTVHKNVVCRRRCKDGTTKNGSVGDMSNPLKKMGSVVSILPNMGDITRKYHPATFPIELPKKYIEVCSNENDYVIEPFAGSGTTIYACENLNRKCIAFEISPEYCNTILNLYQYRTGGSVALAENILNKVA